MFESRSSLNPGGLGRGLRLVAVCAMLAAVLAAQQPYVVATIPAPSATRHSAGAALAPAGDVDLDGSQELLVGFPYNDNEAHEATSDQIAFPNYPGTSGVHVWSPLAGTFVRTIVEPGYALRGFALVNLGDINGDGKPDAAVSNPAFTQPGANWTGRVDAYSGADGSVLWSFVPGIAGIQAGVSLSRIADVNLDGNPDVLVGAPGMTGVNGQAFVISAQTGAILRAHVGGAGQSLGFSTSDAGDVDGDGTSDYAAGAPMTALPGTNPPPGYVRIWSGLNGSLIRTVNGTAAFDRFGRALAPAGDLNGDGVPDLYVGAPSRNTQTAPPGRLYAISGANGATILNATRNVPGDRFGWSLAAVGDRNGDGKVDVAVGTTVGVVEVRSGAFGGVLFVQNGLPGQTYLQGGIIRPFAAGDVDGDSLIDIGLGSVNSAENGMLVLLTSSGQQRSLAGDDSHSAVSSIAALGDLDGDGIRDLAISNREANTPSANDAGQVLIRSSTGATLGTLSGTLPWETLGWSLSTLDDVNNDGVEDFLVSSNPTTAGRVTCHSGATGAPLYSVAGTTPGGAFGYSIARLSDLNGDGIRDFAAGAPYSNIAGLATTGQVHVCSGANGSIMITINGLAGGEFFGTPIAEIGDIDADNAPDFIVGAAYASPGGVGQAGLARIISGANGTILRTHAGTLAGSALGNAVCGAGDVDLDGVPDYAMASPSNTASGPGPAGGVLVHSGATGGVIRTIPSTPIPAGFSVNDLFGLGLSNAGDLDGDGFADLVLGCAPWLGFPPSQTREIHAYSGATGALISKQVASAGFTPFAPSRAATGFDLTGDGAPDWAAFGYSQTITGAPATIVSRAGLPQGVTSTGAGCNLAAALAPVLQTGGGGIVAALGSPHFELLVSRASPNQAGLLVIGASNTSWNGTPLPLNLGGLGLPGCLLHNSVDTLLPFAATPAGLAGFPFAIPANPALAGATAHAQAFLLISVTGTISSSTNGLTLFVQ